MNFTNEFWEKTYRENAPKMLGVCRRYVKNRDVAEDLMHEAFITAISKSDSFAGKGSFDAWLRRITVNSALMFLRQQKSHKIIDDLIENEIDHESMNDGNDIRSEIEQADFTDLELLEVIDSLPEHHKLVFNMYVIDGFSHIQIGNELNISIGTSKSHLARARKKIQQILYQKALEKNQEKKKRKRALLLLFAPADFIGSLFKAKLANYSIEPVKTFNLSAASNTSQIGVIKTKPFFASKLFIGAGSGLIILSAVVYYTYNFNSPETTDIKSVEAVISDTLNKQADTIQVEYRGEIDSLKSGLVPQEAKKKPVIIKQQIIQRKTVLIRDTIRIIDTTNAQ